MKEHLQTSLASAFFFLLAAVHSPAQGTINFVSSASPTLGIISNATTGVTAKIAPGGYFFGLYLATTTNAFAGPLDPVLLVTNSGFAGSVNLSASSVPLNGLAPGATFLFEVKGWVIHGEVGGFLPTFEAAVAAATYVGVSAIGQVTLGAGQNDAGRIFGSSGGAVAVPILASYVPEPATLIMGGLGAAIVVAGRRRK